MNILILTDQDITASSLSELVGIDVSHNNTADSNIALYDCAADTEIPSGWANTILVYGSCKYAANMPVSETISPSIGESGLADIIAAYLEEELPSDD